MGMPEMHRCFTLTSRSGVAGWAGPTLIPLEWGSETPMRGQGDYGR